MVDWPLTLPQYVQQDGYNEMLPDPTVRTAVDAGPAKVRRRYTAVVRKFSVRLWLTGAELDIFQDFFESDIAFGSIQFTWVHPRTRVSASCRIIGGSVNIQPSGPNFMIGFDLEVLP